MLIAEQYAETVDVPDMLWRISCVMDFLGDVLIRRTAGEDLALSDSGVNGLVQIVRDIGAAVDRAAAEMEE
ncbi:MAG: hypothetical protein SWH61_05405 [Thermodesulfobacteriota bacterium]|nr:hypothetical protein [Thermodesulfobacteriota bacterium]